MKRVLLPLFVGILFAGAAWAQTGNSGYPSPNPQPSTSQAQPQTPTGSTPASVPETTPTTQTHAASPTAQPAKAAGIAPGSVIPVSLVKTVDAKKAKNGDEVMAKVTQDLKTTSGELIVPKDTKVVGHVTAAQARNKDQKESQLAIVFDHAEMKNGGDMNVPMSIQAVIGQQQNGPPSGSQGADTTPGAQSAASMPTASMPTPGRSPMPGATASASASPSADADASNSAQPGQNSRAPITAQTQGVIGISDLTLVAADAGKGSVLTSEKNNVKLESGTMMLLRVNQ